METQQGQVLKEGKVFHTSGALSGFFRHHCAAGGSVAVETFGNGYWWVDEIEAAGLVPLRVNARKAQPMMDNANQTDRLDNRGINRLQRTGTLPTVWVPPQEVRDPRELPRTRMMLVRRRTPVKNRFLSSYGRQGLGQPDFSDPFAPLRVTALRSAGMLKKGMKMGRHQPGRLILDHPARGMIAVSGRFAVTLETRSCSSFAGRR